MHIFIKNKLPINEKSIQRVKKHLFLLFMAYLACFGSGHFSSKVQGYSLRKISNFSWTLNMQIFIKNKLRINKKSTK